MRVASCLPQRITVTFDLQGHVYRRNNGNEGHQAGSSVSGDNAAGGGVTLTQEEKEKLKRKLQNQTK